MKKTAIFLILLFVSTLFILSCKDEVPDAESSFSRIYDDTQYELDYLPIDISQATDGYVILAARELLVSDAPYMGVQLIKVDEEGFFETSYTDIPSSTVAPTGDLIQIDSVFYFFAMQWPSLAAQLVSTDATFENVQITDVAATYPLAAAKTANNSLLLLSYNADGNESILTTFSTAGTSSGSSVFAAGPGSTNEEAAIIDHLLTPWDRPLPFFCGETLSGERYFNGFYNYTLSLVFGDGPSAVVQGQATDGGVRTIISTPTSFAAAFYQYNENYLVPDADLDGAGISSTVDYLNTEIAELRSYTPIKSLSYTIGSAVYTLFAAETETRQVALYFFDQATGLLAGTRIVGYLNPYTLSSIRVDNDNNLLVLGRTYVSGRFPRIYLNRYSQEDIRKWLE